MKALRSLFDKKKILNLKKKFFTIGSFPYILQSLSSQVETIPVPSLPTNSIINMWMFFHPAHLFHFVLIFILKIRVL